MLIIRNISVGALFFLLTLEVLLSPAASAQSYPFREYNVLDGLPQSQATTIFQDSHGFIWITTKNGLSRFDGIEFINYTRKDGLPANESSEVLEDSLGVLWAVSEDHGLSKFDGRKFRNFPLENDLEAHAGQSGPTGYEKNVIYYVTRRPGKNNMRIFRYSRGHYQDYSSQFPAFDTLSIACVCLTPKQDAFLVLDKYRNVWTWKDSLLRFVSTIKFDNLINEKGKIIFREGTALFEYAEGRLKPWPPAATDPGAGWRQGDTGRTVTLFDGTAMSRINLPIIPIQSFIDREGVLWIPSEKNVQRLISTAFSSFVEPDIGIGNVWAIGEDRRGHLWFGSLHGDLMEYDGTGFYKRNDYTKATGKEVGFYKGSRKMSNGELWFSTDNGILVWNGERFSRLKLIPSGSEVCYIYEDTVDKAVMVGAGEGLYIIKNGRIKFRREMNDPGYGVVEGVTRDSHGKYWLSGHKGLVVMDGDSLVPVREELFPHINSYTLLTDKYGGIWVTSEDGLYFREPTSDKFRLALPAQSNMPANSIFMMDSIHILVGRLSDICMIDLDKYYPDHTKGFRLYNNTDGFSGNDCLDNGIIRDLQGAIWIATSNRIVRFEPSRLKENLQPPQLNITGLYCKSDTLDWVPATESGFYYGIPGDLILGHKKKTIRIEYTGISTTNPEKVTYRYRLLGFNSRWSQPVKERSVIYENLPHGKYVFELTASNSDGISGTQPLALEFRIQPAFWQTKIFLFASILLLIAATVLNTRYFMRKRQERLADELKLKSELAHLQMNSVLKQFDPHFTFNVISSVGSLIMKENRDSAYEYITRLSGLLRTLLNDRSAIVRSLSEELEFVTSYCELQKLRFKERLTYSVTVDRKVDKSRMIPKMTIQIFVENAIKHGFEHKKEGGRVDVEVLRNGSGIDITISDNGIGRQAAGRNKTTGTGQGLRTIADIFEMMNKFNRSSARVEITDLAKEGQAAGTMVRISIPDDYSYDNI